MSGTNDVAMNFAADCIPLSQLDVYIYASRPDPLPLLEGVARETRKLLLSVHRTDGPNHDRTG